MNIPTSDAELGSHPAAGWDLGRIVWQLREVRERWRDIQQRQRFGFYDSLVVAAALEAGCRRLLSEDLQHGQRIGALRVENPFRV